MRDHDTLTTPGAARESAPIAMDAIIANRGRQWERTV